MTRPRTWQGRLAWYLGCICVGMTGGMLFARLLSPAWMAGVVLVVTARTAWIGWPMTGFRARCETCGTRHSLCIPLFNEQPARPRWLIWLLSRPDLTWYCDQHWLTALTQRARAEEAGYSSRP